MTENQYRDLDQKIVIDNQNHSEIKTHLCHLCDVIGTRFVDTPGYRKAADYMAEVFRGYGLDKVELEPFELNAWKRGEASCHIAAPMEREIPCHELPYSGSTQKGGVTAGFIDVGGGTEKELEALGEKIRGKIALCTGLSSHRGVIYRACEAMGALGFLLACPKPGGIFQTGSVRYEKQGGIPAFSVSLESALLLQRLEEKGIEIYLNLESNSFCQKGMTWNVVGEIKGTEFPDELVLMGGHLDSHEISPGAFDNAAGSVLVTETARLLCAHKKELKRSVRFILFSGEEVGLLGAHHHAEANAEELKMARFMLNADTPNTGFPKGLAFHAVSGGEAFIEELSKEMGEELSFKTFLHAHSDHFPFILQGLPTAGMGGGPGGAKMESWYHMEADTPEKVPYESVDAGAAFAARFLLRASNRETWPFVHRTPEEVKELVAGLGH